MTKARVVIIGGGIMGVSLLYHLVKQGWQDIILAEKNDLTHGSTWHAAGLCTHFSHNPTIQELRAISIRLYRDILPAETGDDCGFHPTGAMRITGNSDRMDEFRHVAGLSEFTGYSLEVLTPDRIAELHPLARTDGLIGGIYEPDDGHVDPSLCTHALARVARDGGALIWRDCPVRAICREGDDWIVDTAKGPVRARHIVNAAGTWGWEVGKMMGMNIPSVPVLHQYLVTDSVQAVTERKVAGLPELPIIRNPEESWYVRQERGGLILGPYEKSAQVWSVDGVPSEFGADLMPADLDRVEHIITAAMKCIPALETAGIKSVINGPITFTPDANPLIGPAHGLPNAWLLTGSSMGVMEGGGAGWFLAHWMTRGGPPLDALAVDSRRFGQWADRAYRVAKAIECFGLQFGVHYPREERPAGRNIRKSSLHQVMLDRGAVMGAAHGWERPNWFSDRKGDVARDSFRRSNWFHHVARECQAATETAALADLSCFSKFRVDGPDTGQFLLLLGANTPPSVNRIGLTHSLSDAGGVLSEFTVARLAEDSAYLTSAAAAEEIDSDLLLEGALDLDVTVRNVTESITVIGLMGPMAADVLGKCSDDDLDFPWLSHEEIQVAGCHALAMRMSYIGESGYELHLAAENAVHVFLALENAGKTLPIGCYGAFAANSMRLEKGYRAWGSDLTTERSPIEAGLSAFVRAGDHEFRGKAGLASRKNDWEMVLLEVEAGEVDPFHSHTIWQKDHPVGIVTSGDFGHRSGKTLALGYLRHPSARTDLSISVLGRHRRATILSKPPFDPENLRLKVNRERS